MLSKEELQEMIVVYGNNHNACRAARELLSLREQLAALKALEPFCHVFLHPDGPLFNGIVSDSCDALPVTEYIYSTQSECLTISTLIKERKPDAVLMCSEVYR